MLEFQNTAATSFSLDVARTVRLLGQADFAKLFGASAAAMIARDDVKLVAYETENEVVNRGAALAKDSGLVSIWILGMMNAGPRSAIVVPYRAGAESELGPTVESGYFGSVPGDRLKVTPEAVLFRADGKFRSKIGTSQLRARNVLGSVDFASGVLTLVQFTMPDDPAKHDYLNNKWGPAAIAPVCRRRGERLQRRPRTTLASNSGRFFEIESISPAPVLKTGESLVHCHRTIHVQAAPATLAALAEEILGVDLERVEKAFP